MLLHIIGRSSGTISAQKYHFYDEKEGNSDEALIATLQATGKCTRPNLRFGLDSEEAYLSILGCATIVKV